MYLPLYFLTLKESKKKTQFEFLPLIFFIFLLKILKDWHLAKKTDLYFYSAWIYQMKRATFG